MTRYWSIRISFIRCTLENFVHRENVFLYFSVKTSRDPRRRSTLFPFVWKMIETQETNCKIFNLQLENILLHVSRYTIWMELYVRKKDCATTTVKSIWIMNKHSNKVSVISKWIEKETGRSVWFVDVDEKEESNEYSYRRHVALSWNNNNLLKKKKKYSLERFYFHFYGCSGSSTELSLNFFKWKSNYVDQQQVYRLYASLTEKERVVVIKKTWK